MTPLGSHLGTISESELSPVDQKRGSRNCFQKWYPPRLKSHPIDKPRGSWRRRLACAFSTTKTTAWTTTAATTATTAKTTARLQFLFEVVAWIQLFVQVFVRLRIENWKNVRLVAPIRTQGPWSDTPWAKARRIFPRSLRLRAFRNNYFFPGLFV